MHNVWSPKPIIYNIVKVSQLMNIELNIWNSSLINAILSPFEAAQVFQIPLSYQNQQDQLIRGANKDEDFTVKSGYHMIKKGKFFLNLTVLRIMNQPELWKKLWKLRILPKQAHLIWRILNNIVSVRAKLQSRGISCPLLCPRCSRFVETILVPSPALDVHDL